METLIEKNISCPYCGESIEVLVDRQESGQQYIEDCQVCCKPIVFEVMEDSAGHVSVTVHDENETY